MTFRSELSDLRIRLASARSALEGLRISGRKDKYVDAFFLVESLEAEMEAMRQQAVRSRA